MKNGWNKVKDWSGWGKIGNAATSVANGTASVGEGAATDLAKGAADAAKGLKALFTGGITIGGSAPAAPPPPINNGAAILHSLGQAALASNPGVSATISFLEQVGTAADSSASPGQRLLAAGMAIGSVTDLGELAPLADAVAPSSRALGTALEGAGFARAAGEAAHHIVAGAAQEASAARSILQKFGVGINDAANGVFLPGNLAAQNAAGAAVHSTVHASAYYQAVNEALAGATTKQEVLDILSGIRQALLSGGFP